MATARQAAPGRRKQRINICDEYLGTCIACKHMSSSTCRCLPLAVPSRAAGRLTYPTTSTTTRNPRPSPTFSTFLAASRIKTSFLNTVIIISCSLLTCNPPTRSAASTARTSCDANLSRSERSATNFLSEGGKRHPYIADEVKKAIRLGYIGARVITTGTRSCTRARCPLPVRLRPGREWTRLVPSSPGSASERRGKTSASVMMMIEASAHQQEEDKLALDRLDADLANEEHERGERREPEDLVRAVTESDEARAAGLDVVLPDGLARAPPERSRRARVRRDDLRRRVRDLTGACVSCQLTLSPSL